MLTKNLKVYCTHQDRPFSVDEMLKKKWSKKRRKTIGRVGGEERQTTIISNV